MSKGTCHEVRIGALKLVLVTAIAPTTGDGIGYPSVRILLKEVGGVRELLACDAGNAAELATALSQAADEAKAKEATP